MKTEPADFNDTNFLLDLCVWLGHATHQALIRSCWHHCLIFISHALTPGVSLRYYAHHPADPLGDLDPGLKVQNLTVASSAGWRGDQK